MQRPLPELPDGFRLLHVDDDLAALDVPRGIGVRELDPLLPSWFPHWMTTRGPPRERRGSAVAPNEEEEEPNSGGAGGGDVKDAEKSKSVGAIGVGGVEADQRTGRKRPRPRPPPRPRVVSRHYSAWSGCVLAARDADAEASIESLDLTVRAVVAGRVDDALVLPSTRDGVGGDVSKPRPAIGERGEVEGKDGRRGHYTIVRPLDVAPSNRHGHVTLVELTHGPNSPEGGQFPPLRHQFRSHLSDAHHPVLGRGHSARPHREVGRGVAMAVVSIFCRWRSSSSGGGTSCDDEAGDGKGGASASRHGILREGRWGDGATPERLTKVLERERRFFDSRNDHHGSHSFSRRDDTFAEQGGVNIDPIRRSLSDNGNGTMGDHDGGAFALPSTLPPPSQPSPPPIPRAYLDGSMKFCGLTFLVDRSVMIPRRGSEEVVNRAVEALRLTRNSLPATSTAGNEHPKMPPSSDSSTEAVRSDDSASGRRTTISILDLGTGSGCLLVSILHRLRSTSCDGGIELVGVGLDASADALVVARRNAVRLLGSGAVGDDDGGVADDGRDRLRSLSFVEGRFDDLSDVAPGAPYDAIVCNPPYHRAPGETAGSKGGSGGDDDGDDGGGRFSRRSVLDRSVVAHEPHLALFARPPGRRHDGGGDASSGEQGGGRTSPSATAAAAADGDDDDDALVHYREVVESIQCHSLLREGGRLVFEVRRGIAEAVGTLLRAAGYAVGDNPKTTATATQAYRDGRGSVRVVVGRFEGTGER